jgi:hypothetical protein
MLTAQKSSQGCCHAADVSMVSPVPEILTAFACSACTIAALYRIAGPNRASGWRRVRHPSHHEPRQAAEAVFSVEARASRLDPPRFSQQMAALAQAVGETQPAPVGASQDQNAVLSARS